MNQGRLRLLFAAPLLTLCVRAFADDNSVYQRHYERARELVHVQDLRGAIKEFEAAYAAAPKPEPLFNIGVLYEKLVDGGGGAGDAQRSMDSFEMYVDRYRALHGADPIDLKAVERRLHTLRERISTKVSAPAAPPVAERRAPPPVEATPEATETEPPVASRRVPPAQEATPDLSPAVPTPTVREVPAPGHTYPTVSESAPPFRAPSRKGLIAPIALGAGAVVIFGVGLGVYLSARSDYDDVVPGCTPRCAPTQLDPIRSKAYAGYALLAIGGAAAAADAAAWIVFAVKAKKDRRSLSVVPGLQSVAVGGEW